MLPYPAEERSCDSSIARLTQTVFDVALNALILLEVSGDEVRGFVRADSQLLGKSEWRLSINDSKVDRFRPLALRWDYLIDSQSKDRSCGAPVDVLARRECFCKVLVAG